MIPYHIDSLVQECSISSALAMEILQSCNKPLISFSVSWSREMWHKTCRYSTVLAIQKANSSEMSLAWWRHQIGTFSELPAISAGNSLVTGKFPAQRLVTRSFHVFFYLRLNKWLGKQSWGWWFETPSCSLWRHSNGLYGQYQPETKHNKAWCRGKFNGMHCWNDRNRSHRYYASFG